MTHSNRVNGVIGQGPGIGGIPVGQWLYLLPFIVFMFPLFLANKLLTFFFAATVISGWFLLTGNDPTKFFETLHKPKKLYAQEGTVTFNKAGIPKPDIPRNPKVQLTLKNKRVTMSLVESKFKFLTYGQINLDGRQIGYYLLQDGPRLMFIFCWEIEGHDPSLTEDQASSLLEAVNSGLAKLPYNVDLKGYDDLFRDGSDYWKIQQQLKDLPGLTALEKGLLSSRQKRTQDLEEDGQLLHKRQFIFAKYRVPLGAAAEYKRNNLERILSDIVPALGLGKAEASPDRWAETIKLAYQNCWKNVNVILSSASGFGVLARPYSGQELFERDWYDLHKKPAPLVPQLLLFDELGLHEPIINSHVDSLGVLFSGESGYSGVPDFGDSVVYLPIKNKFAGFLRIGRVSAFPSEGDSAPLGKARFLHNVMCRGGDRPIHDYRIVWEITRDDSGAERISLDRQISAAVKQEAFAASRRTIDVMAMRRREESVAARDKIEQNNPPCWLSLGIWLYRDSVEQLTTDLAELATQFMTAQVERSWYSTQQHWLGTWPFAWRALLTEPYSRRQKYLSQDAVPQINLIKPGRLDSKGILLIHRESRTPVYLDIVSVVPNHTGVIGFTGAGKSVFMADLALEPVIHNNPVVIFDFPLDDGSSTYTPLVDTLQECGKRAANYNVKRQRMNAIEFADLRGLRSILSESDYNDRVNDLLTDHVELLTTLVLGANPQQGEFEDVNLALSRAYHAFHKEPSIRARYEYAIESGFGTTGYGEMPILQEFVGFAQQWFSQELDADESVTDFSRQVVDKIISRLKGRLDTPLGRSLNGPSSFSTDTDILVVALTSVSEDTDSLIYAVSGMNVLLRKAMQSIESTCICDEGTTLFRLKPFAKKISALPPTARKWGCNFILGAQTVEPIFASGYGNAIFGNFSNIFMGYASDEIVREMTGERLGMRPEIARNYLSVKYRANKELSRSYWYCKRGTTHMELTYTPSELHLALSANSKKEVAARKRFQAQYGTDDPQDIRWLFQFAKVLADYNRRNVSVEEICPDAKVRSVA